MTRPTSITYRFLAETRIGHALYGFLIGLWAGMFPFGTRRRSWADFVAAVGLAVFRQGPRRFVSRIARRIRPVHPRPFIREAVSDEIRPTDSSSGLSCIIAVVGLHAELERVVRFFLQDLEASIDDHPECEFIVVADGPVWALATRFPGSPIRVVPFSEKTCHLPARLFNAGLRAATRDWVCFVMPDMDLPERLRTARLLRNAAVSDSRCVGVTGKRGADILDARGLVSHRVRLTAQGFPDPRYDWARNPSGHLEMLDCVSMCNSLLNRRELVEAGGFSELSVLQRGFWWEACLRLARRGRFFAADVPSPRRVFHADAYPLPDLTGGCPPDTIARLVVRSNGCLDAESLAEAAADLPESAVGESVGKSVPGLSERIVSARPKPPLRMTIIGGPFESHHNEILLFGYFRLLEGRGVLSWRVVDDEYALFDDADRADLIVFTRTRSRNGCRLLDFARRRGVPTLYLLDDNWLTIGRDYSEYAGFAAPGTAFHDHALYLIRNADAVLTFNQAMREFVSPRARKVFELPTVIDLKAFRPREPVRRGPGVRVGFAGNPRRRFEAFEALAEVARARPDVTVVYLGSNPPKSLLRSVPESQRLILSDAYSYREYAETLTGLALDIGLAPLGDTETDRSKNPIKFLDYTAVGCVGIYSRVGPYARTVVHGETGWFPAGETVGDWTQAIETLIDDADLRRRIHENALEEVRRKYTPEVVMPAFLDMLEEVVQERDSVNPFPRGKRPI